MLKDLQSLKELDVRLNGVIKNLANARITSNASSDTPVTRRDLEKFKDETVKALTGFKTSLMNCLSE
jgi:hypothetical protein